MIDETYKSCCGCGACFAVCPKNSITMQYDYEGFLKPHVNRDLCIKCGYCDKVCSSASPKPILTSFNDCVEYYGYSKDPQSVRKSSSGGISYELGRAAVENGYKVLGVRYDEKNHTAVADIAEKVEDLDIFRGSKYVEADFSTAFRSALNSNSKFLVIATPCLIVEMYRAAQLLGRSDDFIFVDFVCHGTPPNALWHRYLEKYGELSEISYVSFRCNEVGWHHKAIGLTVGCRRIISPRKSDEFYRFFDAGVYHKRSCYSCRVNNGFGLSDIRIGDAWGTEFKSNDAGVSRIIIATDKGQRLFDKVKDRIVYGIPKERIVMPENNLNKIYEKARSRVTSDLHSSISIKRMAHRFWHAYPLRIKLLSVTPKSLLYFIKKILKVKQNAK